uniref:Ubiquitin-like-conjugating enzyme ATG3 n=1 Tax=Meloidogyne incognita TaxID=6306 RepID=A0A914LGM4_MELIC
MNDLVNQFKSAALAVGQYLTPVLKESKFKETGVLTPEEFVAAGDHLVHLCPTWSWAKSSDSNGTCTYLPVDKQFLITKQVPCHQRCAQIMGYDESKEKGGRLAESLGTARTVMGHVCTRLILYCYAKKYAAPAPRISSTPEPRITAPLSVAQILLPHEGTWQRSSRYVEIIKEESAETGDDQDEWVDTHHFDFETNCAPKDLEEEENNEIAENLEENNLNKEENCEEEEEEGGEPIDLDEYLSSGLLEEEDPARFVLQNKSTKETNDDSSSNNLLRTRRYDLHITYDKYYQVPRFWLVGYDENGSPLAVDKMKEDFSQEHADKTITLESHPHISGLTLATIHPCRHAPVMKRLIEQFQESGKELLVIDYLFVFLKFVQAVIPTVEYDYTRSIHF